MRRVLGCLLVALPLGATAAKPVTTPATSSPKATLKLLAEDGVAMESFRYADSPGVRLEGGAGG